MFLLTSQLIYAQEATKVTKQNNKRTKAILGSGVAIYAGTMIGLNELWYKQYPQSKFHIFNDNKEWLQMDKMGHFMTSYYVGYVGNESFEKMGISEKKSRYIGGSVGLIFLTGIEILDGKSAEWGFSWGDQLANFAGAGIVMIEDILWNEQRIKFKYSFMRSPYPQYNPSLLGENVYQELLKDYNGQTYWASCNISSLLQLEKEKFPHWLNIAFGYGVDGLVGGHNNDNLDIPPSIQRSQQYYISLDIDVSRIESKWGVFNTLKKAIGFIKIPSPTISFNKNHGTEFYWFYF